MDSILGPIEGRLERRFANVAMLHVCLNDQNESDIPLLKKTIWDSSNWYYVSPVVSMTNMRIHR